MPDSDHYQAYYQDKLWKLLPAIYRTLDTDSFTTPGPLREMVNRIGAQAAVLRRSIDRLWEDQSIETCDDWVIAYIADLLATNLVASLDARGQRLDVAKTIYYRRRKGTLAVLEEIAADITGWDAHAVEFFRRLGRTRHNFDPPLTRAADTTDPAGTLALELEEGLLGEWTSTGAGGWAHLRSRYGSSRANTAYDEFFHTADFRRGVDRVGWHNIPRLGVFLWRLISFGVDQTTPVLVTGCPNLYSFDPTGRQVPLFAAAVRTQSPSYGENWVSPQEWQLPGPIATALLQAALTDPQVISLYGSQAPDGTVAANSMGVFTGSAANYNLIDSSQFLDPVTGRSTIYPEVGLLYFANAPAGPPPPPFVTYHYGFSSNIGAGPYDRRLPGVAQPVPPAPVQTVQGGDPVVVPMPAGTGTATILDSLTYSSVDNAAGIENVMIQADAEKRPVFRLPVAASGVNVWTLTGNDTNSTLEIDGLLVSGGDILLAGKFASVTFSCCTLDPGDSGQGTVFAQSVDQRDLRPCRLWIEAEITQLTLDRCITGPVHTRNGGSVTTLSANDSILQGIRTSGYGSLTSDDVQDPVDLAAVLLAQGDLAGYLQLSLGNTTVSDLQAWYTAALAAVKAGDSVSPPPADVVTGLNGVLAGASLYQPGFFADVALSPATLALLATNPSGLKLAELNRRLLEEAYPVALGQAALGLSAGEANLSRCTLLGRAFVHRLEASECVLNEFTVVDDTQHGCVRFSAWAQVSVLPRQYESVEISDQSPIFTSRQFGQPGYGQLSASADAAILAPAGGTILAGAQNGSEMGAFARDKNPIKDRSILIKYQEYMPLGLVPVLVHVT
jgi:hypothetical protein